MTARKPKLTGAGVEIARRVRSEIDRFLVDVIARFSKVESRLDEIDARLAALEARR